MILACYRFWNIILIILIIDSIFEKWLFHEDMGSKSRESLLNDIQALVTTKLVQKFKSLVHD